MHRRASEIHSTLRPPQSCLVFRNFKTSVHHHALGKLNILSVIVLSSTITSERNFPEFQEFFPRFSRISPLVKRPSTSLSFRYLQFILSGLVSSNCWKPGRNCFHLTPYVWNPAISKVTRKQRPLWEWRPGETGLGDHGFCEESGDRPTKAQVTSALACTLLQS